VGPEVALVAGAGTSASQRVGLTGKSSAENIDGCEVGSDGADIVVTPHVRPVLRQHGPTKRIDFHLPLDLKARAFKPQVEPADPRE